MTAIIHGSIDIRPMLPRLPKILHHLQDSNNQHIDSNAMLILNSSLTSIESGGDDYGAVSEAQQMSGVRHTNSNTSHSFAPFTSLQSQLMRAQQRSSGPGDDTMAKMLAVLICIFLGAMSILLNIFVISALVRNRRRVLRNVFYVLVLHCAIVDLIRGGCLIAWGIPNLLIGTMRTMEGRLLALRINQFTLVVLRSSSLLTIFNLLLFTMNEFVVITYPLHYKRWFRRSTVLAVLVVSWLASLVFGMGSVFSGLLVSTSPRRTVPSMMARMGEARKNAASDGQREPSEPTGTATSFPPTMISMLAIFCLCYLCLFMVLICYGIILYKIREFHRSLGIPHGGETGGRRSLYTSQATSCSASSRPAQQTQEQHRKCHRYLSNTGSHISQQSGYSIYSSHTPATPSSPTHNTKIRFFNRREADPDLNNGNSPSKKNSEAYMSADAYGGKSRKHWRCNFHRKRGSHLMSRHKYLIVISSVLFVDILFLLPYSAIQMVALLHVHSILAISSRSVLIRWLLQILIGVHAVCQPLCYFRMHEFRRLACSVCCGCAGHEEQSYHGAAAAATPKTATTPASKMPQFNFRLSSTTRTLHAQHGRRANTSTLVEFAEVLDALNNEPTTTAPIGDLSPSEVVKQMQMRADGTRLVRIGQRLKSFRPAWRSVSDHAHNKKDGPRKSANSVALPPATHLVNGVARKEYKQKVGRPILANGTESDVDAEKRGLLVKQHGCDDELREWGNTRLPLQTIVKKRALLKETAPITNFSNEKSGFYSMEPTRK